MLSVRASPALAYFQDFVLISFGVGSAGVGTFSEFCQFCKLSARALPALAQLMDFVFL